MKKPLIIAAIVVAFILLAMVARTGSDDALSVRMEEVQQGHMATTVMASGTVNYREVINLRTEVTGRIDQLYVEEGDDVQKGDALALISPELFEADVARQQASVKTSQIAIERQKIYLAQLERKQARQDELFKRGVLNTDEYENSQRDVAMAKLDLAAREQDLQQTIAQLAQSQDRLDKTIIRAPIDGVVTALNVKVGETVVAGTTNIIGSSLMDVGDPSAVLAEVKVEETDILPVKIGQEAKIIMASDPDGSFMGRVISIGTTARKEQNTNRNSFVVKILVDKATANFSRLSVNCRAEIFTNVVEGAIRVPVEAILREKDDESVEYVFINDEGEARKTIVKTGIQNDTYVEIVSGLSVGQQLVVGPYRTLKSLKDGRAIVAEDAKGEGD